MHLPGFLQDCLGCSQANISLLFTEDVWWTCSACASAGICSGDIDSTRPSCGDLGKVPWVDSIHPIRPSARPKVNSFSFNSHLFPFKVMMVIVREPSVCSFITSTPSVLHMQSLPHMAVRRRSGAYSWALRGGEAVVGGARCLPLPVPVTPPPLPCPFATTATVFSLSTCHHCHSKSHDSGADRSIIRSIYGVLI